MNSEGKLSNRQLAVIDDLFACELDEQAILAKHKIKRGTYNQWLADGNFRAELNRRIDGARLLSEVLMARYSVIAAAKLVRLTESEKEETARRACLDIIGFPRPAEAKDKLPEENAGDEPRLSDETAGKILAALAEEEK